MYWGIVFAFHAKSGVYHKTHWMEPRGELGPWARTKCGKPIREEMKVTKSRPKGKRLCKTCGREESWI